MAANQQPARINSLAAIASPLQPLPGDARWKMRWLLLPMLELGLQGVAAEILTKTLLSPSAGARLHDEVRLAVRRAPALAEAVRSISLGRGDLLPDLPRVSCRALFVAGSDDALWPPELAATQASRLQRGRAESVAGAGHAVPLERPRETAALLRAHWA
ncbi:alpha/beta fold hydrolase [Vulgatibacter incomptus]|uniref:alpha/beta fold hydrolase n=1 Tax=Vulgatibacter incomptus TaxID=1391653 RepID=UPI00196A0F2D|nr:alpha/beta hydrolase [Vulgatibacter incomptus]